MRVGGAAVELMQARDWRATPESEFQSHRQTSLKAFGGVHR
jgi:hypothetical protein